MKNTPKLKKALLWSLPIISATAVAVGVAVPLSQQRLHINSSFKTQGITNTLANTDQTKYINHNEVSLMFASSVKRSYVKDLVSNLIKNNPSLMSFIRTVNDVEFYNVTSGTGWMLDYSIDQNNPNLVNYYLGSNIHVLQLCYEVSLKNPFGQEMKISIPVSGKTVDSIDAYISQPQGNSQYAGDQTNIDSVTSYSGVWDIGWYKLGNFKIIPVGALNSKNAENSYKASIEFTTNNQRYTAAINNDYSITSARQIFENAVNDNTDKLASDFGVLKTQIDISKPMVPDAFKNGNQTHIEFRRSNYGFIPTQADYYDDKQQELRQEFENLNKMFDTKTKLDNVNKDSTYITKLRYLNEQIQNKKITKEQLESLFPFAKIDNAKYLEIGGFPSKPGEYGGLVNKFNVGRVEKDELNGPYTIIKDLLPFYNDGNLGFGIYNKSNNYLTILKQLTPGSSGSMALNQNNQIVGILWGMSGQNYNIVTPLFNDSKSNLIYDFLKYQSEHDKNSQLLKLFTSLYNYKTDEKVDETRISKNQNESETNTNDSYEIFIDYGNGDFYHAWYTL